MNYLVSMAPRNLGSSMKIIRKADAVARKIADSYTVNNLLTAQDSELISVAMSEANEHEEVTTALSERAYYILDGEITVDDKLVGKPGDVIYIPKDTTYKFSGSFKAVLVNSPPFGKISKQPK